MKNVVIIGLGALGSHVALFARNWKATFTFIDFDKVEQKNVLAQFHTRMGLRQNKAQALVKSFQGLYGLRPKAVTNKVTEDNVGVLLHDADLVIDCTDNIAAREVIQTCVLAKDIPCLHGALSADGTVSQAVWTEHFTADAEGTEGEATCEGGEQLPLYAMAGGLIASTCQRFLTDGTKASYMLVGGANIVRLA
jgi:molybdopterin/thiamine biosynthesis adenylyltransferase